MRGNRSELAPGRKSPRCHVNTPLLSSPINRKILVPRVYKMIELLTLSYKHRLEPFSNGIYEIDGKSG